MAMFEITNTWSGGYQATVTVMNHGTRAFTSWQAGWTLPAGQTVASVWNGTLSQSGSAVTVRNANWNGTVAADGTTTFGLVVNTTGGSAAPSPTCQGT
jgi:cellulase/cellobiase CelA1